MSKHRKITQETDELQEQERAGKTMLREWCKEKYGRMIALSDAAGIDPGQMSRMMNKEGVSIGLEAAMLIEMASNGSLAAENLCPSRSELLSSFLQQRGAEIVSAK